ncbi:lysylphosphatidylglycerol synthase transmembrane domain-containing protein [Pedobacter lithocola]|uniref:Lysylphosphatidylglycerol synthase transmembrane domain-containing protein n=1 Tax=Pedobacter lithocola TaxID=1908239 RepID=A0ABV8PBS6_9SPHI
MLNLKSVLKYLFLFCMGIGILYLAFKDQNLGQIWAEIKNANFLWVALSAISVWIAHVLRALRWRMLFHSINYNVTFWNTYHAVIIGYLANLALPRFGEIGRCSVMLKSEKVPMFASIGTVITERLFDMFMLLLSALLMLIFQYDLVSDFLFNSIYVNIAAKIHSINYLWSIVLIVLILCIILAAIYFIRKALNKKFLRIYVGLKQGFNSYSNLQNKSLFITYTLGIWVFYFSSMYLAFSAIQATSGLGLNVGFTALVFSSFAMVAPVQGGLGVFHWMVAQALVLYAVPFKDGLAYATILHSSQFLLTIILGCLSLLLVFSKRIKTNHI